MAFERRKLPKPLLKRERMDATCSTIAITSLAESTNSVGETLRHVDPTKSVGLGADDPCRESITSSSNEMSVVVSVVFGDGCSVEENRAMFRLIN